MAVTLPEFRFAGQKAAANRRFLFVWLGDKEIKHASRADAFRCTVPIRRGEFFPRSGACGWRGRCVRACLEIPERGCVVLDQLRAGIEFTAR